MISLIDKWLDKVTRKYIYFVVCSVLGFGVIFYSENEESEEMVNNNNSWETIELAVSAKDICIDEKFIENKSYEIVKNIYDDVV